MCSPGIGRGSMAKRPSDKEILAQIPQARARAARARLLEPHAASASYDRRSRTLHVRLTNGGGFEVPVSSIPGFSDASDEELAGVEVDHAGVGLRWETLDADLSVSGLAQLVLGRRILLRAAGAAGGAARSDEKAAAARRNGQRGGRPRKAIRPLDDRGAGRSSTRPAAKKNKARQEGSKRPGS